jgi:K+-transporting ATPase c subunit
MDIDSRRDDDWLNSIPLRLRPKIVHTRVKSIYTYLKLGGVFPVLNDIEKTWLCKQAEGKNPSHEDAIFTKKGLIRRYNLTKSFFQKHWATYKEFGLTRASGKPQSASNPEQVARIKKKIVDNQQAIDQTGIHQLRQLITDETKTEKRKHGSINPATEDTLVSANVAVKYARTHDIQIGCRHDIQDARVKACLCPLMSYMGFLICYALSATLQACCKWNADGCTFVFDWKKVNKCSSRQEDILLVAG